MSLPMLGSLSRARNIPPTKPLWSLKFAAAFRAAHPFLEEISEFRATKVPGSEQCARAVKAELFSRRAFMYWSAGSLSSGR